LRTVDYNSATRLQQLSRSIDTIPLMVNMIWTNIATNVLVGTRSRERTPQSSVGEVTLLKHRTIYNLNYGIVGFVCCGIWILLALAVLGLSFTPSIRKRIGPRQLRRLINTLSVGRALATLKRHDTTSSLLLPTKDWLKTAGRTEIDLSDFHVAAVGDEAKGFDCETDMEIGTISTRGWSFKSRRNSF
jgi:hypothetical protein